MKRRIAITGLGTISSAGEGISDFQKALFEGKRCFSKIEDTRLQKLKATHAGLIHGFESNPNDPHEIRCLDRNTHLALNAMRQAVAQAGLAGVPLGTRCAVVLGTCSGGMRSIEKHYAARMQGATEVGADLRFSRRYYTTAKVLAWAAGIGGPALTVVTACAAGSGAIASGADLIRANLVDRAVVGGSDTFAPSTLVGFDALKATCEGMCAPFSNNVGLNLGEGSAFFVLEEMELAEARGATLLSEVLGYGMSNDAYHPTAPDPSLKGQVASMERALADADIRPEQVDYINAHGTGTRANDPIESRSIARVFGPGAKRIPVSSTKSIVGHCLGAAGVMEAAAVVIGAQKGFLPSTAGFDGRREGCNHEDYVPDAGRGWQGGFALSNSFGFGGNNATVIIDTDPKPSGPLVKTRKGEGGRDVPKPVITGIGSISPLGYGVNALVQTKRSGLSKFKDFTPTAFLDEGGIVTSIDPREVDRRLDIRGMDRCAAFATLAARMALSMGGMKPRPSEMAQVGLILGIAAGPNRGEMEHVTEVLRTHYALDSLGAFPYVVPNSVSGHVARSLMLKGYNNVLAAGVGAGLAAIASSCIAVTIGHTEKILAVSSDELSETVVNDGAADGLFVSEANIVPGEGSCALLIETERSAEARKVAPMARVLGYGMCTDIENPRKADGGSLERAIEKALETAKVRKNEIDHQANTMGASEMAIRKASGYFPQIGVNPSLVERIGFAEASLPLFNLSALIHLANPKEKILATSLSPEGFGYAVVVSKI